MFQFEIDVRPGREAERFTTAIYRFLELHGDGVDALSLVKIESCPTGPVEHKTVTLWSEDALAAFQRFWAGARRS